MSANASLDIDPAGGIGGGQMVARGIGGDEGEWPRGGKPDVILDNLYADKKAVPMIVVMPNGRASKDLTPRSPFGQQGPAFAAFAEEGPHTLEITTLDGECVLRASGSGPVAYSLAGLPLRTAYSVSGSSRSGEFSRRLLVP